MAEILDIVNEKDEVIDQVEREEAHKRGLTYRSSGIFFYTPQGELILQKRSMTKKTQPGKLTLSIGGHVQAGKNYFEAAVIEAYEESGVAVDPRKLVRIGTYHTRYIEREGYFSDSMRTVFAYPYDGGIQDLKVEAGEGDGFVKMSFDATLEMIKTYPQLFADFVADKGIEIIESIKLLK